MSPWSPRQPAADLYSLGVVLTILAALAALAAVVAAVAAVVFALKARSARAALTAARTELDRHGSRLNQADDARRALENAQQALESERDGLVTARDTALREQDTAIAALGEEQQRRAQIEAEVSQLRQRLHEATVAAELAEATRAAQQADPNEPDPGESSSPAEATEPLSLGTDNAGREPDGCWALLLADIERRWAAVVGAPTEARGVHLGAVADQLSEALGRETDRLREEVGVDISLTAEQPIDLASSPRVRGRAWASAPGRGSTSASSTMRTTGNVARAWRATASARLVLPTPPGPASVTI